MRKPLSAFLPCLLVGIGLLLSAAPTLAQGQNVDAFVSTAFTGLRLNRSTNTYDTTGTIRNISTDKQLAVPLSLVVTSISQPSVTLANLTGTNADGKPYLDVPVTGGILSPGHSVGSIALRFYNPGRVSFTFTVSVRAGVNVPPVDTGAPTLYITSPANGALFRAQPITITGTINDNTAQVMVNGVAAEVSGGTFTARNVPLPRDGYQIVTAIATDPAGNIGQASITLGLDTTAPVIHIDTPPDSLTTSESSVP